MYEFNARKTTEELIEYIKNYFKDLPDTKLVVGLSGGKDSTIVAAAGVKALGKDRVIGVFLPDGEQEDKEDAYNVAKYLDIKTHEINISPMTCSSILALFKTKIDVSKQTEVNLPARIRMCILFAVAQSVNGRVSCNCNLSEDWIGYSTYGGDNFGSVGFLRNLTVTEVKQIGKELGLPDRFIDKVPSDGLCGKSDEDNFGFSYEVLDRYIRTSEIDDIDIKNKIDKMHQDNLFKLKPMECFDPKINCTI